LCHWKQSFQQHGEDEALLQAIFYYVATLANYSMFSIRGMAVRPLSLAYAPRRPLRAHGIPQKFMRSILDPLVATCRMTPAYFVPQHIRHGISDGSAAAIIPTHPPTAAMTTDRVLHA
jgi:hypothetical protein